MKPIHTLIAAVTLTACIPPLTAQAQAMGAMSGKPAPAAAEYTEAEVKKVDIKKKWITLKHGEIKNLGMMPMTMAFQVRDVAMLRKLKPGDKVRFKAIKDGENLVVTELAPMK